MNIYCREYIRANSHYLMTVFIVLQGFIYLCLCIILHTKSLIGTHLDIFATLNMILFYSYMVHYAYHSIKYAYYLELIGFLVMSTISSFITIGAIFYLAQYDKQIVKNNIKFRSQDYLNMA